MPITMPDSTSTAPTDRSMPPVMMTAVMPIAMIATKAKLRVTLNRFCWVAKTSLASDSTTNATTAATETQKVCWLTSQLSQLPCTRPVDRFLEGRRHVEASSAAAMHHAVSIAPVMRPVTSSGRALRDRLVGHLLAAPQHDDAVGDGEHVGHAVADQHDRDAVVAQAADQVQHLGDLAHADRRRRLVHQHDLRVRQPRAGDRDRLALAAGHAAHQVARPRLRLQLGEQLAGALEHARGSPGRGTGRSRASARGRGRRSRPRSGCRTARGPGRRSRCRASRASAGLWKATFAALASSIVPALGG